LTTGAAACLTQPLGCIHTKRFELSPIQSSQTHKNAAVSLWPPRQCVHTSRVESSPVPRV